MATKKAKQENEVVLVEYEAAEQTIYSRSEQVATEPTGFYATADFTIEKLNLSVKAGERFQIPAGWTRDLSAEELRAAEKLKQGAANTGMIFNYPGEIVNPGERNPELRERRTHTVVLPLEVR